MEELPEIQRGGGKQDWAVRKPPSAKGNTIAKPIKNFLIININYLSLSLSKLSKQMKE